MNRSQRIVGAIGTVVVAAVLIIFSLSYNWFGTLISSNDGQIDDVYKALLVASIPFFVLIVAFMLYCVIEFRVKPGEELLDGEPLHGSTRVEIVWTTIPTVVVLALAFYAWSVLHSVEAKKPNELNISVIGQQFAWNYEYPSLKIKTSGNLVVPINRPLYFSMTSEDVIHSFYVPNARLKRDVADGFTTHLRFTPDKLGTYPIICNELCGIGHATMRSSIQVVTPSQFKTWVAQHTTGSTAGTGTSGSTTTATSSAGSAAQGKALFSSSGCAGCHTLAAAGASGKVGPDLDAVGKQGAAFVRTSIIDPNAVITKGFSKGIMPDNFGTQLSKSDVNSLVAFIVNSGK